MKFKITIIDTNSGTPAAEIIESYTWPVVNTPQHILSNGRCGIPIKVELIVEAHGEDLYDSTGNL